MRFRSADLKEEQKFDGHQWGVVSVDVNPAGTGN